ncbi:MAG: hypothetical protein ACYS8Z_13845 [Planctomycetota bacterium]|jgi:hypothetical protein
MLSRKTLRSVHLVGTVWFMLCVSYVLIVALRQVGVRWWVVFSLSGHGVLIVFMLVSLYLFAIFRGVSGSEVQPVEHPLTSTEYYTVFYVTTPFLGGLAGCIGMIGVCTLIQRFLLGVSMGTLVATFLVWVIVDPVAGVLEVLVSPEARKHRSQRLSKIRALKVKEREEREHLLADILEKENLQKAQWAESLKPHAERLAELLSTEPIDFEETERQATDMGANAWQIGGLACMRQLREMTIELCRERGGDIALADYISVWWDGVGNWRNPTIQKAVNTGA